MAGGKSRKFIGIQWHASCIVYKRTSCFVDKHSPWPWQFTVLECIGNVNLGCSSQFLRKNKKERH